MEGGWLGLGVDHPERLEQAETVLFLFLGQHLVEDVLVENNGMPGWDHHPRRRLFRVGLWDKPGRCVQRILVCAEGTAEILWAIIQIDPPSKDMVSGLVPDHGAHITVPCLPRSGGSLPPYTHPVKELFEIERPFWEMILKECFHKGVGLLAHLPDHRIVERRRVAIGAKPTHHTDIILDDKLGELDVLEGTAVVLCLLGRKDGDNAHTVLEEIHICHGQETNKTMCE